MNLLNRREIWLVRMGGALSLFGALWLCYAWSNSVPAQLSVPSLFRENQPCYEAITAKVKALRLPHKTSRTFYANKSLDANSLAPLQGSDRADMTGKVNVWINDKGDASVQIIAQDSGEGGFVSFNYEEKPDLWKKQERLSAHWSVMYGGGD
ncbi:MAG: hypothetical protein NT023_01330 [Armatimonadetes bacterium]|nr:hypothetical protein [Armatimonadota bacterium]